MITQELRGKKIFVTTAILPAGMEKLRALGAEVGVNPAEGNLPPGELIQRCQGQDALLVSLNDRIDRAFLEAVRPQVVANYAVGFNNIDLKACQEMGIAVSNTPDVLTNATADMALTLMLAVGRHLLPSADYAREGKWPGQRPQAFLGLEFTGKTLGVLGSGRIGQAMAKRCRGAFDMQVLNYGRRHKDATLEELFERSDVLSIHTPLTDETRGMVSYPLLKRMKKTALLINTSRGTVIDQNGLIQALEEGLLFGVGLDVTDPEPLPPSSKLYQFPRVLISPHIGSATYEARTAMSLICAENIRLALTGQALLTPVI